MGALSYILIGWLCAQLNGCITLQAENPVVERNKRYRPTWVTEASGVVSGGIPGGISNVQYFLYVKKRHGNLLQAVRQAEWEGKWRFSQQGVTGLITMEDLYYEGRLDAESRQKTYDVYVLFASPISAI